jgi:hypothetical protein
LQKKFDKIKDQEKLVKKGEIQPNDDMLAKFAQKDSLKAEIKELKDLCDLYIKSNPDYDKKENKLELTQKDIQEAVVESLRQVQQVLTLASLLKDDASLAEANEGQVRSITALASSVTAGGFEDGDDAGLVAKFSALD